AIEVPMFETMAQFVLVDHMAGRGFAPEMGPPGYSRLLAPDRRPLHTRDGYVCVLVYTDRQFEAFFRAIGRTSEFAADPRFADHATRARHYPEIYAILADIFRGGATAAWLKLLREADIPCVPLNDLDHLIDDPHLAEVGLFEEIEHPSEGKTRLAGIASRWSRAGPGIDRHPPRLGEHSVEVLREAGYSDAEISRLCREGAAVDAGGAADRAAGLEEAKAPPPWPVARMERSEIRDRRSRIALRCMRRAMKKQGSAMDQQDVIVVGGGNAALCAALAAREQGVRVAVLERAPVAERGGNSTFTAGAIRVAYRGVDDLVALIPDLSEEEKRTTDFGTYTEDQYFDDMARVTQHRADPDLVELLVRRSHPTLTWLRQ